MKVSIVGAGLVLLSVAACDQSPAPRVPTAAAASPAPAQPSAATTTTTGATIGAAGDAAEVEAETPKADETAPIPSECLADGALKGATLCVPDRAYAKKLCGGTYPEVALGLFRKGTPFTRAYLAGDVDAWNASGGRANRAKLMFDEEVIVLARNGAPPGAAGAITMTGAQPSFDVLRWDGTCASVMEGELTAKRPPAPKRANVSWGRLEETTRHALLEVPKVKASHMALDKACAMSATITTNRKACEGADKAFTKAIVESIRAGAELPAPARRP